MQLQNGRPENTDGRLDKEIRVYDFLDKLGVEYQRVDHEAAMTMEACEAIDRVLGDDTAICKNLFLCNRQDIAENIQLLTVGHGTEIRKNLFEQTKKQRKHDAGINSLYTKLFTAGKKTDDQQYHIQDHRDRRKRKRNKVGQNDSKTGNAADRSMAWNQEKIYRCGDDRHGNSQDYCFQ